MGLMIDLALVVYQVCVYCVCVCVCVWEHGKLAVFRYFCTRWCFIALFCIISLLFAAFVCLSDNRLFVFEHLHFYFKKRLLLVFFCCRE